MKLKWRKDEMRKSREMWNYTKNSITSSNSSFGNFVSFNNSSLCSPTSIIKNSGATSSNFLSMLLSKNMSNVAAFSRRQDMITFASTTSIMVYHLSISSYLLAKDSLILSDNSSAFSSLNSLLDTILFNRASRSNFSLINRRKAELPVRARMKPSSKEYDQSPLRLLKSDQSNPNFTLISINNTKIPVVSSVSGVNSTGEWITPNTLNKTKSITAPINPQPIISSREVILSAITTDLSSFDTIAVVNNYKNKNGYLNSLSNLAFSEIKLVRREMKKA